MSEPDDKPPGFGGKGPTDEVTEETRALVRATEPIDPWRDLSPLAADLEARPTRPPWRTSGFDAESLRAELEGARRRPQGRAPSAAEAPEPAWVEAPAKVYEGDGPFAVAMDAPKSLDLREALVSPPSRALTPPATTSGPNLAGPMLVARRAPKARVEPRPEAPLGRAPERRYPLMRALLQDPDEVPHGHRPRVPPAPPPVPGTFFPAAREPIRRPAPADLDELLSTMAAGLLIGESADGHTEIRVTLRDEFFAGTELRIQLIEKVLHATLHPPDREVYWTLNGNLAELRERLTSRGLEVETLEVIDP